MARISEMPDADPLDGTEHVPIIQGGENRKAEYRGLQVFSMKPTNGQYYDSGQAVNNRTDGNGGIGWTAIPVPWAIEVAELVGYVSTGAADAMARYGIYFDDGTYSYPGELVVDAGTVDCSTSGYKSALLDPTLALQPGLYWMAAHYFGPNAATMPVTAHTSGPFLVGGTALPYNHGWRQANNSTVWPGGYGTSQATDAPLPATAPSDMAWSRYRSICGLRVA